MRYCKCGCGESVSGKGKFVLGHLQAKTPEDFYDISDTGFQTPCWLWNGYVSKDGYGSFNYTGAHRYFYLQRNGSIPSGQVVHHLCNNKSCVNPGHLKAVSPQANKALEAYPPFTKETEVMEKYTKSFRFSLTTIDRLDQLSDRAELSKTAYLEQLIKSEFEKTNGQNRAYTEK